MTQNEWYKYSGKHAQPVKPAKYKGKRRTGCLGWLLMMPAIGVVTGLILALTLTTGCQPRPGGPPTDYETPAPNAPTKEVCDATREAHRQGTLGSSGTRDKLIGLANKNAVDGRVRDSIVNGLYAGDTLPQGDSRYRLVVSACERTGWKE